MRLLLVTRADPALRLHRVRLGGGLAEIRSQDLAFTQKEAVQLFERSNLDLTEDQLRVLLGRTQGWPAGLRLAVMSLVPTDIAEGISRFTGTQKSVAEYLIGEVLDRQPPQDRDFLLKTSIAEQLSASLATALTDRRDSQLILETLVAANSFVVSVGGQNQWFRYHPFVAGSAGAPAGIGAAGRHRTAASAGGAVVCRTGRTDPGDTARDVGRCLGRCGPTADHHRAASAPEPGRAGPGRCPTARRVQATQEPTLGTLLAAAAWHFHSHDFASMHADQDRVHVPEVPPAANSSAKKSDKKDRRAPTGGGRGLSGCPAGHRPPERNE